MKRFNQENIVKVLSKFPSKFIKVSTGASKRDKVYKQNKSNTEHQKIKEIHLAPFL